MLTKVHLEVDDNTEAIVLKRRNKRIVPYTMIGNGIGIRIMEKYNLKPIDTLREMSKFTKSEMTFFMLLRDNLDWDNKSLVVRLPMKKFNSTIKQHIKVGFKRLHEKDLVRRVKRGVYMINPAMILPPHSTELEQITIWNNCKSIHTKDVESKPKHKPKSKQPTKLLYEYNGQILDLTDEGKKFITIENDYGEEETVSRNWVMSNCSRIE